MRKLFFVIFTIIICGLFTFGIISYKKETSSNFDGDGYIIENNSGEKYYFSSNDKYKYDNSDNLISFTYSNNNESQSKTINDDVLIHYLDNSFSIMKKASIIDLSNMNQTSFKYYNVYEGATFTYFSDSYKTPYLDKELSFKEFILKISSNKYLIVSPNLKIKINDDEPITVKSGYIELTFDDGNICVIQNQEIDKRNVSSSIAITLNDSTYIDIGNKKIYYIENDVATEKINLGEITIDSDDYIDIEKEEIISKTENKDESEETQSTKKTVIHQGEFPEVSSGVIDAAEIEVETIVEENAAIKDAVFTVTDMNVTANSLNATVSIKDEEATLSGTLYIKIIKTSTNEVVYYEQDNSNSSTINIEVLNLTPQTNYILILNRDYIKNNVTYNKDFVQKTFVTSSLGINIQTNYLKTNQSSINIIKNDYSKVNKVNYKLYDNTTNDEITNGTIEFLSDEYEKELSLNNLDSNHEYSVILSDFVYGNTIINSSSQKYTYTFKTLKSKPIINTTSFSIDKKSGKFVVYLGNITDTDGGIKSYRVDVYDASSNEFVTSKTSEKNSNIEFNVDNTIINRNTNYRFYAYIIFDDNEKEFELPIGSKTMVLNGKEGPIVTFYSDDITWERIKGRIEIQDSNNTINTSESIIVTYQNLTIGTEPKKMDPFSVSFTNNKATLSIDINNLKSNDSYLFTVKGYVDYHDGNGYSYVDISQFIVQTDLPNTMTLSYTDKTSEYTNNSFMVEAKLTNAVEGENVSLEASTMKSIKFKLYSIDYDETSECTPSNKCWENRDTVSDGDMTNVYNSPLKAKYYDNKFYINEETVGATSNEISYGQYILEVSGAYDYTTYKNELPIIMEEQIVISANNASGSIINNTTPVEVSYIYNNGTYEELTDNTQIGMKVTANIIGSTTIQYINYSIYDADTNRLITTNNETSSNGKVVSTTFNFSNNQEDSLVRGKNYYFKFDIGYTLNGNLKTETSTKSSTYNTKKMSGTIDIYLSTRNSTSATFNYIYKDIDKSYVDSKLYYYIDSDTANEESIVLTETTTQEGTFTIPFTGGTINAYANNKIYSNSSASEETLIAYYMSDNYSIGTVNYSIAKEDNKNITDIVFSGLDDIKRKYIVGVDLTLTNCHGSVTLKNQKIENDIIKINYVNIKDLMAVGNCSGTTVSGNEEKITIDMDILYDTGVYGVNSSDLGYGFALQKNSNSYKDINSKLAFGINYYSFSDKKIKFAEKSNLSNITTYSFRMNKSKFVIEDEDISIKQLNVIPDTNVTCIGDCTFSFNDVTPTVELTSSNVGITTFDVNGTITGVDSDLESTFKIHAIIKKKNSLGVYELQYDKEYTLSQFNAGITIDELDVGAEYEVTFNYTKDSTDTRYNFYYTTSVESFNFKTKNDIGLSNTWAYYRANAGTEQRTMVLTYKPTILKGYTGIKYLFYYYNGSEKEEVSTVNITDDLLSDINSSLVNGKYSKSIVIHNLIETGKQYYIDIIPYVTKDDTTIELVKKTGIKFNFIISNPTVTVNRISDIVDSKFDIRVYVKDTYNAMTTQTTYNVYIIRNETNYELIGSAQAGVATTFSNVSYDGASCEIVVKYNVDLSNLGLFVQKSSTFTLNLSSNISIGTVYIGISSSNIRLMFKNSYKIREIDKIIYSIYDSEYNAISSAEEFTPTWGGDDSLSYTDLPVTLDNGSYSIELQYYSNDTLVDSSTLDYAKS